MNLRERILATRAEAEHRLALAEAATLGPWEVDPGGAVFTSDDVLIADAWHDTNNAADAAHIAANDPTTVAAEQRRIIQACDADLELAEWLADWHEALDVLTARYPEVEA